MEVRQEKMQLKKIKNLVQMSDETEQSATLYLYGEIINSPYLDDAVSSQSVIKALAGQEGKDLVVHINSYGGDVFEAIAIENLLKGHEGKITTVIDGIAASGGSIIAMAGDKIQIYEDAQMLIHNPWTLAVGDADELRKTADDLDKIRESLMQTYQSHFKGSEEDLSMLLDNELYLTAQDALEYGLVDDILTRAPTGEQMTPPEKAAENAATDSVKPDQVIENRLENQEVSTGSKKESVKNIRTSALYQLFAGN